MTTLHEALAALLATWEDNHADWCCTGGCPCPDGQHIDTDGIHEFLDQIGRGEVNPQAPPTHPCTGECTCDVGLYTATLRAALERDCS